MTVTCVLFCSIQMVADRMERSTPRSAQLLSADRTKEKKIRPPLSLSRSKFGREGLHGHSTFMNIRAGLFQRTDRLHAFCNCLLLLIANHLLASATNCCLVVCQ